MGLDGSYCNSKQMPSSIDLVNLSCTGIDVKSYDKIDVVDKNTTQNVINDATKLCMNVLTDIQLSLDNDTFWLTYDVIKSPADGYCFVHSVAKSWFSQLPDNPCFNKDVLLEKLKKETYNNAY